MIQYESELEYFNKTYKSMMLGGLCEECMKMKRYLDSLVEHNVVEDLLEYYHSTKGDNIRLNDLEIENKDISDINELKTKIVIHFIDELFLKRKPVHR